MDNIFSSSWYRVTDLTPRLREHVEITSHKYRGETWHVYQDTVTGRTHRFSPIAHALISLLNGKRSVNQAWEAMNSSYGDDAPTQDEIIQLLSQLHTADLLISNVTPQIEELFNRSKNHSTSQLKTKFSNPIALRFSLLDPESLLTALQPWCSWMFSKAFAIALIVFFLFTGINVASEWPSIASFAAHNTLQPDNLLLLWLTYPLVKLFHELGHAVAIKHWGGEVHETGIMLLLFTPVPYVDASASTAFRNKYKRMIVSSAGIIVELLLAAFAAIIWLNVEPGMIQDIAFNVMLIGGVSTLLFNGNPLLRYDAYYMLSDFLDIPNLGNRANKYFGYLLLNHLFGVKDFPTPVKASSEAPWLFLYSISSFCYRMFILFFILLYIIDAYLIIGMLLAIWVIFMQILKPLVKNLIFIFTDTRVRKNKLRTIATVIFLSIASYLAIFAIPLPYNTVTEGVVSMKNDARIIAHNDGFITTLLVNTDEITAAGTPLLIAHDPALEAKILAMNAELSHLNFKYQSEWNNDRIKRKITSEKIKSINADIKHIEQIIDSLTVRSPMDGKIVIPKSADLLGRFKKKGDLLGYILDPTQLTARVFVSQDDMSLINENDVVRIRLSNTVSRIYPSKILRKTPAATNSLHHAALGTQGGGTIIVDATDKQATNALDKHFEIWVSLPDDLQNVFLGSRLYVKFNHGEEVLSKRLHRWAKQLFLGRFNV